MERLLIVNADGWQRLNYGIIEACRDCHVDDGALVNAVDHAVVEL